MDDLTGKYFTYLEPSDGRKGFNKKAKVYHSGSFLYLQSYDEIVARYNINTSEFEVYGLYSQTTRRHIKAFMKELHLDYNQVNKYI